MRQVRCTLPEGGEIVVEAGGRFRSITRGTVIDLDQELAPARPQTGDGPTRVAVTYEAALGHHVTDHFEPVKPSARTASPRQE
jgi:hypothetical protein